MVRLKEGIRMSLRLGLALFFAKGKVIVLCISEKTLNDNFNFNFVIQS